MKFLIVHHFVYCKNNALHYLRPFLQSLSVWPRVCKLAGMVEQTGGYNFSIKGKTKKSRLVQPGALLSIIICLVFNQL